MYVDQSLSTPPSLLCRVVRPILRIDDRLRRRNRVVEYSSDPNCLFRIQFEVLKQDIAFANGAVLRRGQRVIDIHLWNEHIPAMPPEGATMGWARRFGALFGNSLGELVAYIERHPELEDIAAIRAYAAVATAAREHQLVRLMMHFGFEAIAESGPIPVWKRLRRRAENLLGLLLTLAVNPAAARISILSRTRSQVVMPSSLFHARYGRYSHAEVRPPKAQRRRAPASSCTPELA